MDRDLSYLEAQQKIADALLSVQDLWGPRKCIHGYWSECEEDCTYGMTTPAEGWVLNEWTILATFMEMETGESFFSAVSAPRQPSHHTKGLLLEGFTEWLL